MNRFIVFVAGSISLICSGLMGAFAALEICEMIWGSSIIHTALGNPPDRAHPAFYVFALIALPGLFIGCVGAIFGIILPLHIIFNVSLSKEPNVRRLLTFYYEKLVKPLKNTAEQDAAANP